MNSHLPPFIKVCILLLFWHFLTSCSSTPPAQPKTGKAPVILVHGFLSKGYWLNNLKHQLIQEGHPTIAPALRPSNGSVKMETLAQQLKKRIEKEYGPHQSIHLVAHSMGGLISRYYLEELGGKKRALSLQTIATPHYGAPLSILHPGPGGIQMRPGSHFLKTLNAGPRMPYPETSYFTKSDLIVPYRSSIRPRARNVEIPHGIHHSLPKHQQVVSGVIREIQGRQTKFVAESLRL